MLGDLREDSLEVVRDTYSSGGPVTNLKRTLRVEPSLCDLDWRQRVHITAREGGQGRFGRGRSPWGSCAIDGKGGCLGVRI
jgi:hypothetical protein